MHIFSKELYHLKKNSQTYEKLEKKNIPMYTAIMSFVKDSLTVNIYTLCISIRCCHISFYVYIVRILTKCQIREFKANRH